MKHIKLPINIKRYMYTKKLENDGFEFINDAFYSLAASLDADPDGDFDLTTKNHLKKTVKILSMLIEIRKMLNLN